MDQATATAERPVVRRPAIEGAVMARGTLLTKDIDRLTGFCRDCLNLDTVALGADRFAIKDRRAGRDGAPYWILEARLVDTIARPQSMLNHWGVTVETNEEVDRAFAAATAHQEKYGLTRIQKPRNQHGSYAFYIADADSNWWEVECREPGARYWELADLADGGAA